MRGKKRSEFTDIIGVGLCQHACVESRCECTGACARQEGRAQSKVVTYCNLEYREAQLCRIWA